MRAERAVHADAARAGIHQAHGEGADRAAANLALDAETQANVLNALDALTIAPDVFKVRAASSGLRSIYRLAKANSDDQLREVVARMWDMATYLEDRRLDAPKPLRSAEEQLRQALERGATDEVGLSPTSCARLVSSAPLAGFDAAQSEPTARAPARSDQRRMRRRICAT